MLVTFWDRLSNAGVDDSLYPSETRYIVTVNRFGVIAAAVSLLVLLILVIINPGRGINLPRFQILVGALLFISVIAVNQKGYYNLAKWMISWFPALMILIISISEKMMYPENIAIKEFIHFRFFLMAVTIIPVFIFSTRNMMLMIVNLIPSFIATVFFNPIHDFFGVSIHQFGYTDPYFYILDIMIFLAYISYIGFLVHQRTITDNFEFQLSEKQERLVEKNKELSHMNAFINEQNSEMNAQSEKLMENHEALLKAHTIIEQQKIQLEKQNCTLEALVQEKTKKLSMVNEELVIRNNELRQFSHTLSHNLKSPVATFQGLLSLIDLSNLNDSNKELLRYLNESVNKMQGVFSDMNKMLEIRNKLYNSVEEVNLQKLMDGLHNYFYNELSANNIRFEYNFNGSKSIRTNEKQINSILYQLISNAIKFRSEKRTPEVCVQFKENGAYHSFVVKDNGVGIHMNKYADKIFYPYQQFHNQSSGKGLGLYLVKLQTESLGGQVILKSEPDNYTEVEVKLRK